jgi:hypothetical protein
MLQEKLPPLFDMAVPLQVSVAIPDKVSLTVPVELMVDTEKISPSVGETTLSTGGVVSMFKLTFAVAVVPNASVTVPLKTWFAPSDETTCEAGQLVIATLPGVQVKVTVTAELFQPASLGDGETDATMAGGPAALTVKFVENINPFSETKTVVVPELPVVTSPLALTPAILEFPELQVTSAVTSWVVPSEKVPIAVNCWLIPPGKIEFWGFRTAVSKMGTPTLRLVEPVTPA